MIHVIATVELHPGRRDEFLRVFWDNVPRVLAEAGCLEYGPAVDVASGAAAQPPLRDDVVTVVEKWESVAALQAHFVAPHMLEYRRQVADLVRGVTLHVLTPAPRA